MTLHSRPFLELTCDDIVFLRFLRSPVLGTIAKEKPPLVVVVVGSKLTLPVAMSLLLLFNHKRAVLRCSFPPTKGVSEAKS